MPNRSFEEWSAEALATLSMTRSADDTRWRALFAPDGTYEDPVTGRTADLSAVYAVTRATFSDYEMRVTKAAGDHGGGVIEWTSSGHLPHGPLVVLHGCSVIDFGPEGTVRRWRDYFDMGEFDRQATAPGPTTS